MVYYRLRIARLIGDAKTRRAINGLEGVVIFIISCSISATTNQTARSGNRAGKLTTLELQDFSALLWI
jgi:hypothetical protein